MPNYLSNYLSSYLSIHLAAWSASNLRADFSQPEWPSVTASCSGVRPSHLIARSAPWLSSTPTASARLPWTATCSGVAPVEERRLTSARAVTRMPGWSKAVESVELEAANLSTRGSGRDPSGRASPWERRAARSH
eukprot:scaffold6873_cov50-Phaeocystis_antarctica.AAC.1